MLLICTFVLRCFIIFIVVSHAGLILSSGQDNFCLIHVSLIPVIGVVGEQVSTRPVFYVIYGFLSVDLYVYISFSSLS